jgi:hypothetical protein
MQARFNDRASKETTVDFELNDPESVTVEHCVIVSSRDRDRSVYPNTNYFVTNINSGDTNSVIPETFKNIQSIELVQALIPQSILSGTTGAPYLTLEIPELGNTIVGTNNNLSRAFGYLSPQDVFGTTHLSTKFYHKCKRVFKPERASMGKLTIAFKRPDGSLFDFGTDTSTGNPVNENVQTLLYFIVRTREARHGHVYFR